MEVLNAVENWSNGYGYGDDGAGNGTGYGDGYGGTGYDDGGTGYGDGTGYDNGIKSMDGIPCVIIDRVPTLITRIVGNYARGYILHRDLTMAPCYIAKDDNTGTFAHGDTLREARYALDAKLYNIMPVDKRCDEFCNKFKPGIKYSNRLYYEWHNILTGSCRAGRDAFVRDGGYDLDGESTVSEFITICEDAYGGNVIKLLKERYKV